MNLSRIPFKSNGFFGHLNMEVSIHGGVPPKVSMLVGCSMTETIQLWGYHHDYGNPQRWWLVSTERGNHPLSQGQNSGPLWIIFLYSQGFAWNWPKRVSLSNSYGNTWVWIKSLFTQKKRTVSWRLQSEVAFRLHFLGPYFEFSCVASNAWIIRNLGWTSALAPTAIHLSFSWFV